MKISVAWIAAVSLALGACGGAGKDAAAPDTSGATTAPGGGEVTEGEDQPAVADVMTVDHVGPDFHRHAREAGPDFDELDPKRMGGAIALEHALPDRRRDPIGAGGH